ncbi:MAG: diacylglycerol/lipid kinase family protein [Chitinophagaceae bacterium]
MPNVTYNIVVLINSQSGGGKGLKLFKKIELLLQQRNISYDFYVDNWIDNLDSCKMVWLIGGDGTLNYFINKYKEINVPIALFKGGTGNDFAWKLYGNISLEEQIKKILEGNVKLVDAGLCNDRLFLNGVGIGFDGEILKNMQSIRWLGGHLGYLLIVIAKIFNFKEYHFKVTMNNKIKTEKLFLMSVFNSSRTGGGFYIAPKALIDDGLLDVIQCKPLSILNRLKNLPVIEKGKHLNLPFINYTNQQIVVIECNQELPAQIDGELFFAQQYHIEILPAKFKFLC